VRGACRGVISCLADSGGKDNRPSQLFASDVVSVCAGDAHFGCQATCRSQCLWPGGSCVAPCSTHRSAHARVREDRNGASVPGVLSKRRLDRCRFRTGEITRSFRPTTPLRTHSLHLLSHSTHCTSTPLRRLVVSPGLQDYCRARDRYRVLVPAILGTIKPHPVHDDRHLARHRDRGFLDAAAFHDAQAPGT
jgi:hypothetical protein